MRTRVGYCGGNTTYPTYQNLGDYTETIDIDYDPNVTAYDKLLHMFWENHDPTVCRKRQYMSAIFYHDDEQKHLAEKSKLQQEQKLKTNIATKILPFIRFYDAESYHQKYILQTYHKALFRSLNLSNKELITSHVAARLNGYVCGYGSLEVFNEECQELSLPPDWIDYVRKQIKTNVRMKC